MLSLPQPVPAELRALAPHAHRDFRSARGIVRTTGRKVSLVSTRLQSMVDPARVPADLAPGSHLMAPDAFELVLMVVAS